MINTNWTQPKRNMIAALNDLRSALAAGQRAKLIKINNEDCQHPIKVKNSIYTISRFKRKVWAVQLLKADDKQPRIPVLVHVLNALAYPLKFVATKSVLRMEEYKCVTFRIGAVTNGYELSIQIPKKFGFK